MSTVRIRCRLGGIGICLFLLVSPVSAADPPIRADQVPELRPGILAGYLTSDNLPDSAGLLPPPPPVGSAADRFDLAMADQAQVLRDTKRWDQARHDAALSYPGLLENFACSLGFVPSEAHTPHLAMLIRRVTVDAGMATMAAKQAHVRQRPFVRLSQPVCTPEEVGSLAGSGSYPSGHASVGWLWALLLTEIAPDRRDMILKRGLEFGDSRVICGVHWASDVEAGRLVASATYAALQSDQLFRAQMMAARQEVTALRTARSPTPCSAP